MAAQNDSLHILIMAGGSGTRFWPKSRMKKPKQLLNLWDDRTLIEHTIRRFLKIVSADRIWIVTTKLLEKETKKITNKISKNIKILSEPEAKNTAACILWGSLEIQKKNRNATIAVMPADHYIADEKKFISAVKSVSKNSETDNAIYIIGIEPNKPETGFGYIEIDKPISELRSVTRVKRFVEKPKLDVALQYISSKRFLWNAGMFIFNVNTILNAYQKCMPLLYSNFNKKDSIQKKYSKIQKQDATSFDYAIMEKLQASQIEAKVLPLSCGWNDVGSFAALEEINCAVRGDTVQIDSNSNVIQSDKGIVALLGVENLVVVRDGDVVMVANKNRCQDVKLLIEELKKRKSKLI